MHVVIAEWPHASLNPDAKAGKLINSVLYGNGQGAAPVCWRALTRAEARRLLEPGAVPHGGRRGRGVLRVAGRTVHRCGGLAEQAPHRWSSGVQPALPCTSWTIPSFAPA